MGRGKLLFEAGLNARLLHRVLQDAFDDLWIVRPRYILVAGLYDHGAVLFGEVAAQFFLRVDRRCGFRVGRRPWLVALVTHEIERLSLRAALVGLSARTRLVQVVVVVG